MAVLSTPSISTNGSMMGIDFLPPRLIVVGGSYVGLEFGQMFLELEATLPSSRCRRTCYSVRTKMYLYHSGDSGGRRLPVSG